MDIGQSEHGKFLLLIYNGVCGDNRLSYFTYALECLKQ